MEIVILLVIFYLGFQIGGLYVSYKLRDLIIKEAISRGIEIPELEKNILEKKKNKLVIEHNDNVLYLYDFDTNTFICQGSSIEELAKLAKEYKNIEHAFVLDSQSNIMFTFIDGKVV